MAFSDPQTVTVNAVAQVLPRTGFDASSGTFTKDDGTRQLLISHAYGKRTRRAVKFTSNVIASDPLVTGNNLRLSSSVTVVIDQPTTGLTPTQLKDDAAGLLTWLTASSNANLIKLIGGEI